MTSLSMGPKSTPPFMLATISAAIFLVSLATFNLNLLGTASPSLFANFQIDSDKLVLEALRTESQMLGIDGPNGFRIYPSQFGAQVPLLRTLGGLSFWSPAALTLFTASLMAAMVALTT